MPRILILKSTLNYNRGAIARRNDSENRESKLRNAPIVTWIREDSRKGRDTDLVSSLLTMDLECGVCCC